MMYLRDSIGTGLRQRLWWLVIMRFVAGGLVLSAMAVVRFSGWLVFPFLPFSVAPLTLMLINQPYPWLAFKFRHPPRLFLINLVIDIFIITYGLHLVGGMDMFVGLLVYPLVVIYSGFLLKPWTPYMLANLAAISYSAMVYLEYHRIIPHISSLSLDIPVNVRMLFACLTFLLYNLIAYFSSYLTNMVIARDEELMREQGRFSDIASHAGEWIWEIDADGRYLYAGPIVEQVLGYKPKEILGRYIYDFFYPTEKQYLTESVLNTISRKEAFSNFLMEAVHKCGRIIYLETSAVPVLAAGGNLAGYRGVSRDITTRIAGENEMRTAYTKLREMRDQLIQTSKMAAIGQLASGVAHEINNPLTGILNNVQLIKMEVDAGKEYGWDEFKEILDAIEQSSMRCKKITKSLLDFSHASSGQVQPSSVNKIIGDTVAIAENELKLNNIIVDKSFRPDLPDVLADQQLLQQVIMDMIGNAMWAIQKKSGKDGGTITFKTDYLPEKEQVCVRISDTGIGIPPENMSNIFNPFFTTKPVGEGTGLGLSIAYNIIKSHKGEISVESESNKGATFIISLPAEKGKIWKIPGPYES